MKIAPALRRVIRLGLEHLARAGESVRGVPLAPDDHGRIQAILEWIDAEEKDHQQRKARWQEELRRQK